MIVKHIKRIILFSFLHNICIYSCVFAGKIIDVDGYIMYANEYGTIAKNVWVWIDMNNDSIAECYRFDSDGHIAINYKDEYGKETNDKGQLIEDNEVVKKMLSSGKIIVGDDKPRTGIFAIIGNIINPKPKIEHDKYLNKDIEIVEYDAIPNEFIAESGVINNNNEKVGPSEVAENGVIYAGGRESLISDNVRISTDSRVVVGKDFRKFISSKNKCIEKVDKVYIYGGNEWFDVIRLNGDNASVKFNLEGNNYVRFEVAHQTHGEETKDTELFLDMYVDGELVGSFDEFVDGDPEVVEEYIQDGKDIELRVRITDGAHGRAVFIRNGRFRKVKEENIL